MRGEIGLGIHGVVGSAPVEIGGFAAAETAVYERQMALWKPAGTSGCHDKDFIATRNMIRVRVPTTVAVRDRVALKQNARAWRNAGISPNAAAADAPPSGRNKRRQDAYLKNYKPLLHFVSQF
jgi:hypothetical protein